MHSFKEYFQLFLERRSIIDQQYIFQRMIKDLINQIKSIPKLKNGEEFFLDFNEDTSICVKFYTKPPKNIEDEGANAEYIPGDYCINVYLNNLLSDLAIRNPLVYIKKHIPEELIAVLRHELTHAYEDLVKGIIDYTSPQDTRDLEDYGKYFNSLSEINAYFNQHIPTLIRKEPLLQKFYNQGDIKNATLFIVDKVKQLPDFQEMYDKNKKWFFKTIYTTLDQLMNK